MRTQAKIFKADDSWCERPRAPFRYGEGGSHERYYHDELVQENVPSNHLDILDHRPLKYVEVGSLTFV